MTKKFRCIIKKGERIGQMAVGKTITLSAPATADVILTMESANREEQCRASQLRLMWMWATDMAKSGVGQHDTKEDCYWEFKTRFLAPALAADDAEFAQLWASLSAVSLLGNQALYRKMSDRFISHEDCTVRQVASALSEWERTMAAEGINFRHPGDYHMAINLSTT